MKIAIVSALFSRYHLVRLEALRKCIGVNALGIEVVDGAGSTKIPGWRAQGKKGEVATLFENTDYMDVSNKNMVCRMNEVLQEYAPDVVAVPGWSDKASLAAILWCVKTRIPFIIMSDSLKNENYSKTKENIKKKIIRLSSSGFVAGTPHVEYFTQLGMVRDCVFVGYDVIDNDYFKSGADRVSYSEEKTRLGLPHKFFLSVSRFIAEKNIPGLLRGYSRYREMVSEENAWRFVLIGNGELEQEIVKTCEELALTEYVDLMGFRSYNELPECYGLAEVFILASTSETWGLVVNEAMASGLPILVSERCGCAPDLVEKGRNGYTFDPHNVEELAALMVKISSEECDRKAMGEASRKIISRWTPDTFAKGLMDAAEVALNAPRPKASVFDRGLLKGLMWR